MKTISSYIRTHAVFVSLVVILLISIPPRIWQLSTTPGVIVDEPAYLRDINILLKKPGFYPADNQWDGSQATLVYYPTIFLIDLFPTIDHILLLRIVSVIFSICTLIPFFFLVKRYTSILLAFCITILFSYSYYYLEFSRVGWGVIYALSFGLFSLWAAHTAVEKKSFLWIVISGVFGALCFYSYRAGEIYIAASMLYILVFFGNGKKPFAIKSIGILIFCIAFLLVAFPWIQTILSNWTLFTYRERVVNIFNVLLPYHGYMTLPGIFYYQITTTISSWFLMLPSPETFNEDVRYLPLQYPFISIALIPFYWLGIGLAFKYWKKAAIWIFIFIAGLILGQIMTFHPPNGARGLILLPAVYLFIALTAHLLYKRLSHIRNIQYYFILGSSIIALSDFLFYVYWMSWIKV